MKLISSAIVSRRHNISASPKVTTELLPSAFGVHTKNVSSPLRSGEITNAAIPGFGKAETPPALWRRGVQPGSKNGSRFCSCHSPSMREARKYFGFTSWFFQVFDGSPRASTPTMRLRRASFFSLHHWGRGTASAVEGVRLIHSAICKDNRRILCEEHRQGNPNHNRKP